MSKKLIGAMVPGSLFVLPVGAKTGKTAPKPKDGLIRRTDSSKIEDLWESEGWHCTGSPDEKD